MDWRSFESLLWRVEKRAERGWIRRFPGSLEGPVELGADIV